MVGSWISGWRDVHLPLTGLPLCWIGVSHMHFSSLEKRGSLSIPRLQRLCHLASELHPAKLRVVSTIPGNEKLLHAIDSPFPMEKGLHVNKKQANY